MEKLAIYNEFEASLKEIEVACDFIPDVTSKEGYEKSKRIGLDGRKVEKAIDDKRLELKKEAEKEAKAIHESGKALCAKVSGFYKPHQDAYKARDAEIKRVKEEAEQRVTDEIAAFGEKALTAHSLSGDEIAELIEEMKIHPMDFGNRTIEAGHSRDKAVSQLKELRAGIIVRDEEAKRIAEESAELERKQEEQRKAQAIIDEQNRIEHEKLEAARKLQEEEQRKAQEEQRLEAAKIAAANEERARLEREEKEAKKVLAKKAANKAHQGRINSEIKKAMNGIGFSDSGIEDFIKLARVGGIPNVSINY